MDIRMPKMDGLEATRRITTNQQHARTRVLILTTFDIDQYVFEALRAGASGFLLKEAPPEQILAAAPHSRKHTPTDRALLRPPADQRRHRPRGTHRARTRSAHPHRPGPQQQRTKHHPPPQRRNREEPRRPYPDEAPRPRQSSRRHRCLRIRTRASRQRRQHLTESAPRTQRESPLGPRRRKRVSHPSQARAPQHHPAASLLLASDCTRARLVPLRVDPRAQPRLISASQLPVLGERRHCRRAAH
jgi:CheY-like chemotaxis protein